MERHRKTEPDHRALTMMAAYEAGRTLQSIGDEHGITRERVRQIITKYFGRVAKVGGKSKSAAENRKIAAAKYDAMAMRTHGCTWAQLKKMRSHCRKLMADGVSMYMTPLGAYRNQRNNAKARGIEWQFKFWDWWLIWQKSGKWDRRGRGVTDFVMCRHGDTGPYSPNNVSIAPVFKNCSDANRRYDLPVGVSKAPSGRYYAHARRSGRVIHLGTYDTPDEAHKAYLATLHMPEAA